MFPKNYSDQETISAFCFNDLYNDEIFWKTTFGQPWATVLYHWLCVLKEKMLMPVIFFISFWNPIFNIIAFNTIVPPKLVLNLSDLGSCNSICKWLNYFLTEAWDSERRYQILFYHSSYHRSWTDTLNPYSTVCSHMTMLANITKLGNSQMTPQWLVW